MSRVTPIPPPVKTFHQVVRRISSTPSVARSSILLDSRSRGNTYLPRALKDLRAECSKRDLKASGSKSELAERLAAHDLAGGSSSHGFHTLSSGPHRPLTASSPSPSTYNVIPLMQGFRSTARKPKAHDTSTIDFAFLPDIAEDVSIPGANVRVPLLPDLFTPDRSVGGLHAMETLDAALPTAEISVIASFPEQVAAAMVEVRDNDGLDVDIGQLTSLFSSTQSSDPKEPGVLKELWDGLLDDVLGPKGGNAKMAV